MLAESLLPAYRAAFRYAVIPWLAVLGVVASRARTDNANTVLMVPVVVAETPIAEGRRIDRSSVAVAMWPAPTVPEGAYMSVDEVINRVARIKVYTGEPIVPGRLAPWGTPAAPAIAINPGKRAYSVRIDDVNGIAGMIRPNSRVDVLITPPWSGERRIARIFMSNVRVLAIGWVVERAADGSSIRTQVATLELTPEEVERLAIAANQGAISLALRGHGDWDQAEGAMTSQVVKKLPQRPTPPR